MISGRTQVHMAIYCFVGVSDQNYSPPVAFYQLVHGLIFLMTFEKPAVEICYCKTEYISLGHLGRVTDGWQYFSLWH